MDWELLVAGLAFGMSGLSWWAARKSANAAVRSADSAGEQVAVMRTQTEIQRDQLETMREANRLSQSDPPMPLLNMPRLPEFTIRHNRGDGYVVANSGQGTAYDVEFDPGRLVWRPSNELPTVWDSAHAEYVIIAATWGSDPLVRVTYATEPAGERRTQMVAVPGKGQTG
ncbi:hypothetical protein [Dietzia sp. CH92]|uniref:hypothetical protein n=1 Tax=Dietzia sp. CH92 TaxID=3051823 RepID=UPI0028D61B60|nr:hypothetical protein [Dietzia sp. CH92]